MYKWKALVKERGKRTTIAFNAAIDLIDMVDANYSNRSAYIKNCLHNLVNALKQKEISFPSSTRKVYTISFFDQELFNDIYHVIKDQQICVSFSEFLRTAITLDILINDINPKKWRMYQKDKSKYVHIPTTDSNNPENPNIYYKTLRIVKRLI